MDNEIKLTVFLKDYAHHIQANNYDFKIRFKCVNFDLFLKVSNKMYNFVHDNTPDGGMRIKGRKRRTSSGNEITM